MDSVVTYAGIAIAAVVALTVVVFIGRRLVRLAVRLVLVGIFILALLVAGAWGWWKGWFTPQAAPHTAHPAATPRKSSR